MYKCLLYIIWLSCLTSKQCLKVKSSIVDINNHLNQVFSVFDNLNKELSLEFYLMDTFSDCFSFHTVNCKNSKVRTTYQNKLKNIYSDSTNYHDIVLIISNASVKNNIATLVSYIQRKHKIIMKTVHHAINVTFTETKLFAVRYNISQAFQILGITHIVIVTNTIPAAKRIFDMFLHLYQPHSIVIFSNLRRFFNKNSSNMISFWDCLSSNK